MIQKMDDFEGAVFARQTGLLFEANTKIFNPVGITMGVNEEKRLIFVCDTDNPEKYIYTPEKYNEFKKKRDNWMKQVGNNVMRLRRQRLGYIVQGPWDGE